jgi:Tfp pilus assembly protein PilF
VLRLTPGIGDILAGKDHERRSCLEPCDSIERPSAKEEVRCTAHTAAKLPAAPERKLIDRLLLHRSQRPKEAADLLDRAAAIEPGYQVHLVRGTNFQQLGLRDPAIRAWRAALVFQPRNVKLMQVLSVEYSKGRYFQEAAAIAHEALRLQPDAGNLYLLAIKAHHDAGDMDAAAKWVAEATRRFPESARAQFEHGYYLQKRGKTDAAMRQLSRAMELDGRYEESFFFYGDLLVKQSRWEEALAPLRKALEIRPEYSPARVALARALIYFRMGDEDRAREAKETSLRLRRESPALLEAAQSRPFPER